VVIAIDTIRIVLKEQDIEGLIAAGAPGDEYDDESNLVHLALSQTGVWPLNQEALQKIITDIWAQAFNLSKSDMQLREQEIKLATQRFLMLSA
jgi:hypothetical protein